MNDDELDKLIRSIEGPLVKSGVPYFIIIGIPFQEDALVCCEFNQDPAVLKSFKSIANKVLSNIEKELFDGFGDIIDSTSFRTNMSGIAAFLATARAIYGSKEARQDIVTKAKKLFTGLETAVKVPKDKKEKAQMLRESLDYEPTDKMLDGLLNLLKEILDNTPMDIGGDSN